jgi:DNA polymerase-3 subunit delta
MMTAVEKKVIYLLYGENSVELRRTVDELEKKLGGAAAALDAARLEGKGLTLEALRGAVMALPFLVERRLVVVNECLERWNSPAQQQKFLDLLDQIPDSTALVLVEPRELRTKERGRFKEHWILPWAEQRPQRVFVRHHEQPHGAAMADWILKQAARSGGRLSGEAAGMLAALVGDETRLAALELDKLLAYVNYSRPIEVDDVARVSFPVGQTDIFGMVDALAQRSPREALGKLRQLYADEDVVDIFAMIVRQFRLLLLAREVLDTGGGEADVARALAQHPFVIRKISAQAQRFSLPELEAVYRRLLLIDEAIKTGEMAGETALDLFTAEFTAPRRP